MDRHDRARREAEERKGREWPMASEAEERAELIAAGRCPECHGWPTFEPRCHCEEDGRPNATDRALAAAIVWHVRECLDLGRDGHHTVTIGFDVPKPATPYDLDRVVDLLRAELTICQIDAPWCLKDGITVQTFENEGPDPED